MIDGTIVIVVFQQDETPPRFVTFDHVNFSQLMNWTFYFYLYNFLTVTFGFISIRDYTYVGYI